MNTATLKSVIALSALLLSTASLAAEHEAHGSCPHHNNVDGKACSHHGDDTHHADGKQKKHGRHTRHGKHGDPAHMAELRARLDALDLSDAQRQEFGSLFTIYEPRIREIVQRGHSQREALFMAEPGSTDYNNLIGAVSIDASASAGEMVVLMSELQANAYALMTDEQQQKYQALKREARDKAEAKMQASKEQKAARKGAAKSDKAKD